MTYALKKHTYLSCRSQGDVAEGKPERFKVWASTGCSCCLPQVECDTEYREPLGKRPPLHPSWPDTSGCSHQELNSANNLNKLGSGLSPRESSKDHIPASTLVSALWDPMKRTPWSPPTLLTYRNCEMINLC